jgi:hypothetical protein
MLNRRKALIGYAVYMAGKPVLMRAARKQVRKAGTVADKKRRIPKKAVIATAAGAAVSAFAIKRKRRSKADQVLDRGEQSLDEVVQS